MTLLMFLVFLITEVGFAIYSAGIPEKSERCKRRLIVNGAELIIFLIMLLLPHIGFSFRFAGFAVLLVIRLIGAAISYALHRKDDRKTSVFSAAAGGLGNIALIAFALIPAFVISDYQGRPVTGEHQIARASAVLIDRARTEQFEDDGSFREVPVHFFYPADISDAENTLPLVIFSHGAFGWYESNTSTYMELASHGYVVVSLDHPYHAMYTKDSAGKTITVDPDFFRSALNIGSSNENDTDRFERTQQWMELREADMAFALDTLKNAASQHSFDDSWCFTESDPDTIRTATNMIDTGRIGLMGHSLGGATAVSVGRRSDVSAVIDIDGTMLGEETGVENGAFVIDDTPYPTPLLNIDNELHHNDRVQARETGYTYSNNVILDNAVDGHDTYFRNTEHMNLTDLPLFAPAPAKLLGTGSADPADCIDRVNALVLDFFDSYIKDSGDFSADESY
ncbi:MAG: hypothetical protein J6N70_17055 [Oribacterium sp.]|nr:hypothetical protein [Oribacterium sp.]